MIQCPDGYIPYEGECPRCGSRFVDYRVKGPHMAVYCVSCDSFIQFIPKVNTADWKKKIKERDQYTCQRCGAVLNTTKLDAHHKMPVWFMPELQFDLDNGITLCKKCHHALHGAGGTINKEEKDEKTN